MAYILRLGDKYLGLKGVFDNLAIVDSSQKALKCEFEEFRDERGETLVYMKEAGTSRYVRVAANGKDLNLLGNNDYREVLLADPTDFREGANLNLQTAKGAFSLSGTKIVIGTNPLVFTLNTADPQETIVVEAKINSIERANESEITNEDEFFTQDKFEELILEEISPQNETPVQPTPDANTSLSTLNNEMDDHVLNNMTAVRIHLENKLLDMQKLFSRHLQESEECKILAEKCANLENVSEKLAAMGQNRKKYQEHLSALIAALPAADFDLFTIEEEALTKLVTLLADGNALCSSLDSRLWHLEEESTQILNKIDELRKNLTEANQKLETLRTAKKELEQWETDNSQVAAAIQPGGVISAQLAEAKRILMDCDRELNAALENNRKITIPQPIGIV